MSTIVIKRSATPGAVPTAGNLSFGELAINYADQKIYAKNAAGVVFQVNPATDLSAYVQNTRNVSSGGLVTGGGNLSANRTLTVTKATGPEVAAMTRDDVAVTPLGLASLPASSNGSVLITSGTTSSQATLDLALTGGWRKYRLLVDTIEPVTVAAVLFASLSYDGGSTYPNGAADFSHSALFSTSFDATIYSFGTGSAMAMQLGSAQVVAAVGYGSMLDLVLAAGPGASSAIAQWKFTYTADTSLSLVNRTGTGRRNGAAGVPTHLRLFYGAGNIAAGARYELYGNRH